MAQLKQKTKAKAKPSSKPGLSPAQLKALRDGLAELGVPVDAPRTAPTRHDEAVRFIENSPGARTPPRSPQEPSASTQELSAPQTAPSPPPASRRRLTWRERRRQRARVKAHAIFTSEVPEAHPPLDEPDVVEAQVEKPQTTIHCPESIKEDGLKEVRRNPEYYIEINMVTTSRVVDTFYIPAETRRFHYKTSEYKVDEENIYLLPTRLGLFMPTTYYKEGTLNPRGFKQTNKGITGKALSLLYMEQLYTSLLYSEDVKYNLFIVILSIASLIAYGVGCYFLFFHNGGLLQGGQPAPIGLILPWRLWL